MATLSMNIQGKVALITGSAKRIGRETAIALARRGATIAVHYRSSEQEARETLQAVRSARGNDAGDAMFRADLMDGGQIDGLFHEVEAAFGGVDILVNNASVFAPATAAEANAGDWDEQLNANARAPFLMSQRAARSMTKRGAGKIVNLVDAAGEIIWPGYFPYSVSKAALIAVNRGLAKAFAPHIQVNGVAPGPVLFPEYYTEEQKRAAIDRTLLKRAGSPADVVNAILFLIENDYITGEVIHVDGGRHAI
jgi:NAD(P)-dependent dehydrogenase (short-subunit alcohol dehydrogenase family)